MTTRSLLTALVVAGTLIAVGSARADWTPPTTVPGVHSTTTAATALAVGGSGRVATAWVDDGGAANGARHALIAVRVAVRRADGTFSTRTLVRRRDLAVQGLSAAMDARGELTVAWIDALPRSHRTVRAAFRTPAGRWSRVQAVGLSSAFAYAVPRLAVAPDRGVLLSYVAGVRRAPGVAVAWRRPGRAFGAARGVGRLAIFDPVPAFDPAGRAYLSGIVQCDDESASHGVVRMTSPHGRSFGPPLTVAPAPATEMRLQVSGAGRAVATWVGAGCSTSELLSGAIHAATIDGGRIAARQLVDPAAGRDLVLSGAPGGGAEASWTTFPPSAPSGAIFTAQMPGGSPFGAVAVPADGWTALTSDPAGDQVVATRRPASFGIADAVGARQAGSPAIEQAPLAGPVRLAVAGSWRGRTLAVASSLGDALRIATWTPGA